MNPFLDCPYNGDVPVPAFLAQSRTDCIFLHSTVGSWCFLFRSLKSKLANANACCVVRGADRMNGVLSCVPEVVANSSPKAGIESRIGNPAPKQVLDVGTWSLPQIKISLLHLDTSTKAWECTLSKDILTSKLLQRNHQ
jgi:hypothetical protein